MDLPWMFLARCPRCRGCGSLKSAQHDVKSFSLAKCLFYKLLFFFWLLCVQPTGRHRQRDPPEQEGPVPERSPRAHGRGGASAEI